MTLDGETVDTYTEQDDQAVRSVVAGTSEVVDDSQVQTYLMEEDLRRLVVGGGSVELGIAVVGLDSEEEAGSVQGALESAVNDGSFLAFLQDMGVGAQDVGLSDFDVMEDECPLNDAKTSPGMCGCEEDDEDVNMNGIVDCMECSDDTDCPEGRYCHCDGSMKANKRSLRRNLKFGHVDMCYCK
eukprot:CAMPEP_0113944852 /NCGR_PEP_ID=MMETSP1339-20121228/37236_1 /TAXON_ID=94617 /ORGANISM="Fibrocapsa japonica" /LENGTH=183 /DNA_ID=CAMNT_0000950189 /DNA_START=62 /DNA_END=613 /DNA_ORIENTATION=+ /assembly_acc=CAM_ASM_000762